MKKPNRTLYVMKAGLVFIATFMMLTASFSSALRILPQNPNAPLTDDEPPQWRLQNQTKSAVCWPGGGISLWAEGKDNVSLNYAWLATNETGTWQSFTGDNWLDPAWKYCKVLVINCFSVEEVKGLKNFTVLVNITSSNFAAHAQSNGNDFVFTSTTNTVYNHEIESYDFGTGHLVAWVKIPFVSYFNKTAFYLYYGNPSCGNQQNVQGTWDANYIMVHNMTGASASALHDATSNHWDVTRAWRSPTYNVPGIIANSVSFYRPRKDSLRIEGFRLPANSSYTAGAWIYVNGSGTSVRFVFEGNNSRGISLALNSDKKVYAFAKTNTDLRSTHGETIVNDVNPQWFYVCTRADTLANRLDVFVNGVSENYTALNGPIVSVDHGLNVGAKNDNTSQFHGRIDDLRVSNVSRSDGWIKTEYNMIAYPSEFISVGDRSPKEMQQNDAWQLANFTWANPAIPGRTWVSWRIYFNDTSGNYVSTPIMKFYVNATNDPPYRPSVPVPAHNMSNVSPKIFKLAWTGGDPNMYRDTLRYEVYFGTNSTPLKVATVNHIGTIFAQQQYTITRLQFNTTYFWKIISRDDNNATNTSLISVWNFTTIVNTPPDIPHNPSPLDNASGIIARTHLSWTSTDPDGDPVTYDVYFGTISPLPLKSANQSLMYYSDFAANPLAENTLYNWSIVTWDSYPPNATIPTKMSSKGPIWNFTTKWNEKPTEPNTPDPANGTIGARLRPELTWLCTDPDLDPIAYDVYFGTTNPPPRVARNLTDNKYIPDPSRLTELTQYFWKIVAYDKYKGFRVDGPLWNFTTKVNSPPVDPYDPIPWNDTSEPSYLHAVLKWSCVDPDDDPVAFDVFFGDSNPPKLVKANLSGTEYNPGKRLNETTTYYWKIVAWDKFQNVKNNISEVWKFTTQANHPPNLPTDPFPPDHAINRSIEPTLKWDCSDPDLDSLKYDVYFGLTNPPTIKVSANQTEKKYNPGLLKHNTTYNWTIVAWDEVHAFTAGPVWSFTTRINHPPPKPINPVPANHTFQVDNLNFNLEWAEPAEPDGNPVTFVIYLGKNTSSPPMFHDNITLTYIDPGPYAPRSNYYWRVVAWDPYGASNSSELWNFTTDKNYPPTKPNTPVPVDNATNISVKPQLNWVSLDSNGDDLTYDLYFGTANPPPLYAANLTVSYYPFTSNLSLGTRYNWKVIVHDSHGASNVSKLWNFTTSAALPMLTIAKFHSGLMKITVDIANMNAGTGEDAVNVKWNISVNGNGVLRKLTFLANGSIQKINRSGGVVTVELSKATEQNSKAIIGFGKLNITAQAWIPGRPDVPAAKRSVDGFLLIIFVIAKDPQGSTSHRGYSILLLSGR